MAKQRRNEWRVCETCGADYQPWQPYSRFCSKACLGRWTSQQRAFEGIGQQANTEGRGYKTGRIIKKNGYVYLWIKSERRYRPEHRVVMEQLIGRPLLPRESVHHINGQRDDNDPANLELWTKAQPNGVRLTDSGHCPTCSCPRRSPHTAVPQMSDSP